VWIYTSAPPYITWHDAYLSRERIFLISWGGTRLSPLGTSATNWPIVPAQTI
jgi:hypothetical protein